LRFIDAKALVAGLGLLATAWSCTAHAQSPADTVTPAAVVEPGAIFKRQTSAATNSANSASATETKTFDSFAELRATLLNAIGGATKRVWISTSYLTDGELVSSLYVAQYRKVDVAVLLGRSQANAYMSRLNYLKNQNLPVFLRPEKRPGPASQVLCDDQLYELDGELDFMTRYKRFTLTRADSATAAAFTKNFATDINKRVPAIAARVPLVGHVNPNTATMRNGAGRHLLRTAPQYNSQDGSGAYTYGGRSPPRPNEIPEKLPKVLKYEQQAKPPPVLQDDTEQD